MFADLTFLFLLFRETGGIASPFLPAAFLLAALTAFHYGPGLGVLAALSSLALAACSDPARFRERHWSELPLLLGSVALTATYVGWLAQREAAERRDIERLHGELRERAREAERSYVRCREAQDHLVHSERLATIGRMSAEMAHQVRNPLSAISLNLELIQDEIARGTGFSRAETSELIAAIQSEIDSLTGVTDNYLGFAGLPPLQREEADLNGVVREILVFARLRIEQHQVRVSQNLELALPPIHVDRRQLKFAIMNVVTNALEATEPGGRLRVTTRHEDGLVSLAVADTGAGIPRENRSRIFEPFFTTKQRGTGLGLSLAHRIVEGHGGSINCQSIWGVGTTFTISLLREGVVGGGLLDDQGRGREG